MGLPERLATEATSEDVRLSDNLVVPVAKISRRFDTWSAPTSALVGLPKTLSTKPLVQLDQSPVFAEIAIVKLLNADGWEACWVDSFHKCYRSDMPPRTTLLPGSIVDRLQPLKARYAGLVPKRSGARARPGPFGGVWDIIGWKDTDIIFIEAKLSRKDRIRSSQILWLQAALDSGFRVDQFLIVEWQIARSTTAIVAI